MRWIFSGAAALVLCVILLSGCAAEDAAMPETNDVQTSRGKNGMHLYLRQKIFLTNI